MHYRNPTMHYSKLCISDGWMSGWQDEQVIMPIKEIEINMYMDVDCMEGWVDMAGVQRLWLKW